jgi:hypothetical protein
MTLSRREFIARTGSLAALPLLPLTQTKRRQITLVVDPNDSVANAPPVQWAITELEKSLSALNLEVRKTETLSKAGKDGFVIVGAGTQSVDAKQILKRSSVVVASVPESLALVPAKDNVLLACGVDARGLVYALLELSDRLNNTAGTFRRENLFRSPTSEQPANSIRSVLRLFRE